MKTPSVSFYKKFLSAIFISIFFLSAPQLFAAGEPTVSNQETENILPTSVTVQGEVTDEGLADVIGIWVEYGETDAYGQEAQRFNLNELTLPGTFDINLSGLTCDTTYHYRFRARNNGLLDGYSPDATFTTTPCYPEGIVSHWTLNETSGLRFDAYGENDLTILNNPVAVSGQINNGVEIPTGQNQYLITGDTESLRTGGETSFTVSLWVKLLAKTGTQVFVSKFDSVSTGEYAVYFENTFDRFVFSTYGNGGNYFVKADELGSPQVGAWYYITATHDAQNNTNTITIDNAYTDTITNVVEHSPSSADFLIGAFGPSRLFSANAAIDEVRFSKTVHDQEDPEDSEFPIITITTNTVTDITQTTATLNATVTAGDTNSYGFFWGTESRSDESLPEPMEYLIDELFEEFINLYSEIGGELQESFVDLPFSFQINATNLTCDTTYYVRSVALNDSGEGNILGFGIGNEASFTTSSCDSDPEPQPQSTPRRSSGGTASPAYLAKNNIILANQVENTTNNQESPSQCPLNQLLTQNLRTGARNGRFHSYTQGIVTQANILQAHLNRLGFNSGPVDGILGPISDGAIKRMQTFLGTKPDGFVGPITRGLLNNSCGTGGLQNG